MALNLTYTSDSGAEHRHGGVVARDAADAAAAARAGAADPDVGPPGLDAPAAHLGLVLGERPGQVAMEDVAPWQPELGLQLERRARLQARLTGRRQVQAVLDRLAED